MWNNVRSPICSTFITSFIHLSCPFRPSIFLRQPIFLRKLDSDTELSSAVKMSSLQFFLTFGPLCLVRDEIKFWMIFCFLFILGGGIQAHVFDRRCFAPSVFCPLSSALLDAVRYLPDLILPWAVPYRDPQAWKIGNLNEHSNEFPFPLVVILCLYLYIHFYEFRHFYCSDYQVSKVLSAIFFYTFVFFLLIILFAQRVFLYIRMRLVLYNLVLLFCNFQTRCLLPEAFSSKTIV